MKTRTKNIEYKKEKLDLNFNNSQNYILGKSEKKKLLTKFFSETILNKFYNFLSKISFFLDRNGFYYTLANFTFFGFLMIIYHGFDIKMITFQIIFFILSTIILLGIYYDFYNNRKKSLMKQINKHYNVKNINDYFFVKKIGIIHILIYILLYTIIYLYIFGNYMLKFNLVVELLGVLYFIGVLYIIIFFKPKNKISRLKLSSLFFLPFLIIFFPLIIIYNYFYVFFTKGIKGYRFLKNKPNGKILKKFENLDKNYAENEFYLINLKK